MANNFEALIKAVLDTKDIENEIKNKINNKKVQFSNITLNTNGLSAKIQETLNKHQFTLNLTNVKIDNISKTIEGQVRSSGARAGDSFSQDFVNKIKSRISSGEIDKSISAVQAKFNKLTTHINSLNSSDSLDNEVRSKYIKIQSDLTKLIALKNEFNNPSATQKQQVTAYENFNTVLRRLQNNISMVTTETRQFASAIQVSTLQNRMESWLTNNSRAVKTYGSTIQSLITQLKELSAQGNVEEAELKRLTADFIQVKTAAQAAGLTGKTFEDSLKGALSSISRYISASTLVYTAIRAIKQGITSVVELDTALVDLRKTTDGTAQQLKEFYYASNDIAKSLGTTTKEVIQAAADWSRLGYSLKDAEEMAKVSSIFKSISPGMDMEKATDGLVSAMKAFNIEADDALDGIASKINAIGNTQAVSNNDIVEFLTRSSSAMKEANNTLDETIALGTAA